MKILIVDDYFTMRRIIRNLLTQIGHTDTWEAVDGQEALQKLNAIQFDLIISDWNMDPINGLELLSKVRSINALRRIPFILVIPESMVQTVAQYAKAKGASYIAKPFNARDLHEKINEALSLVPST